MLRLHDPESQPNTALLQSVARNVWKVGLYALVTILVLGVFRAITYVDYEWAEAAGHDQVPVLAVKTGRNGMHDDVPVEPIVINKALVVEAAE